MIVAERVCLDGGGTVVRLAGLYSVGRGPHSVWLQDKRVKVRPAAFYFIVLPIYTRRHIEPGPLYGFNAFKPVLVQSDP